ncbi:MAG: DUF4342 domain-containing protein [Clostridiales bacterium]|nr:DUF4342 domain-containing protein [Clostridiales bacterium]MDY4060514.1 DUF4342 domain-containing protein [Anaerovoracaceae bacterium]
MEITLEKIELVKDRTGVSYREAKEALEENGGNVVDAIIYLEDSVNGEIHSQRDLNKKEDIIDKLKAIVAKGNVTKIVVKKDDDVVMNLPVNAGIIGAVVAPWGIVAGLVAAFGFKCRIEVVKDDGSSIDISNKADKIYDKGAIYYGKAGEIFDDAKNKGSEYFDGLKEKAPVVSDMYDGLRDFAADIKEKILDRGSDLEVEWEEVQEYAKDKTESAAKKAREVIEETKAGVSESSSDIKEKADEVIGRTGKKVEEAADQVKDKVDDVADVAEDSAKDALDALNHRLDNIEKELDK